MSDPKRAATIDLARRVVALVAPEETDVFDMLSDSLYEEATHWRGSKSGDASRFGGGGFSRAQMAMMLSLGLLTRFQAKPGANVSDSAKLQLHLAADRKWMEELERRVAGDRTLGLVETIEQALKALPGPIQNGKLIAKQQLMGTPPSTVGRFEARPEGKTAPKGVERLQPDVVETRGEVRERLQETVSLLSSLEQMLMLVILRLGEDAYGVRIRRDLEQVTGEEVSDGTVYKTLDRLEKQGLVSMTKGDSLPERGGRARNVYRIEESGKQALQRTNDVMKTLWESVPGITTKKS